MTVRPGRRKRARPEGHVMLRPSSGSKFILCTVCEEIKMRVDSNAAGGMCWKCVTGGRYQEYYDKMAALGHQRPRTEVIKTSRKDVQRARTNGNFSGVIDKLLDELIEGQRELSFGSTGRTPTTFRKGEGANEIAVDTPKELVVYSMKDQDDKRVIFWRLYRWLRKEPLPEEPKKAVDLE